MTKFKGNGVVWDRERNTVLCRFDASGEYSTDNNRTIQILKSLNYEVLEKCQSKNVRLTEKMDTNGEKKENVTPTQKVTKTPKAERKQKPKNKDVQ